MESTLISWTDHTFNPWMGCRRVSPGCTNCYAERLTRDRMGLELWGNSPRQQTKAPWGNVRKWNAAAKAAGEIRKVFTGSLCDVFEDHEIPNALRPLVFDVIRENEWLDFQLLTKRPENIADMLPDDWGDGYANVWLGTSIENQDYAHRADILREIPARVRFISYEPALGPLRLDLSGIDWLIYGGESGPGYRAEDKQWARNIMADCRTYGTAFFHKQSSAYRTEIGVELDGRIIHEFPKTARRAASQADASAPAPALRG